VSRFEGGRRVPLFWESIAYPYMYSQKIQGYPYGYAWFLNVSLQLSMQVWIPTLISKQGYPCKNNGCSWNMNIHEWISKVFLDTSLQLSMHIYWYPFGYPLISMDIHAWICSGSSILGRGIRISALETHFRGSFRITQASDRLFASRESFISQTHALLLDFSRSIK